MATKEVKEKVTAVADKDSELIHDVKKDADTETTDLHMDEEHVEVMTSEEEIVEYAVQFLRDLIAADVGLTVQEILDKAVNTLLNDIGEFAVGDRVLILNLTNERIPAAVDGVVELNAVKGESIKNLLVRLGVVKVQ